MIGASAKASAGTSKIGKLIVTFSSLLLPYRLIKSRVLGKMSLFSMLQNMVISDAGLIFRFVQLPLVPKVAAPPASASRL